MQYVYRCKILPLATVENLLCATLGAFVWAGKTFEAHWRKRTYVHITCLYQVDSTSFRPLGPGGQYVCGRRHPFCAHSVLERQHILPGKEGRKACQGQGALAMVQAGFGGPIEQLQSL